MAAMTKSGKLVGKWAKVYPDDPFARDIETVAQMSVAFEKEFVWESMSDIQVTKESFMELMNFGWDKELKEFLPILRR
ncbi:hypothetical protein [Vibrio phage RYC]|nr:hypothetical protein [Vibrio phage RYC]